VLSYLLKEEACNVRGTFGHLREARGFPRASGSTGAEWPVGKAVDTYLRGAPVVRGQRRYGSLIAAAARWSPRASSASLPENRI